MAQDPLTREIRSAGSRFAAARRFALAAALLIPLMAASPPPAAGDDHEDPEVDPLLQGRYVERVEVQLVLIRATVLNTKGESVTSLSPADFTLMEDGVEQEISVFGTSHDQPVRVAFLLDVSGSMAVGERLDRAKEAIRTFTSELMPQDQVALLSFADGDVLVEHAFGEGRDHFHRSLDSLEAYGQTALRDALVEASKIMSEAKGHRAALVLVTDGADNASVLSRQEAIRLARQVQVPLYAIGFTRLPAHLRSRRKDPEEPGELRELMSVFAAQTGGEHLPVFGPEQVSRAVHLVESRLRGQYVIGYRPKPGRGSSGFREIDLRTRKKSLHVMARRGYMAVGP